MNCLENENVCSVKKENDLGYYRLHTIWKKDGFFINIASKNGAWRGEMTTSDIQKMSEQLGIEPEAYLNQCKEALTSHGGQPGMVYSVENGYFAWKKVEDEDCGIKIKMGSLMLEPTSFVDTIQNLVTAALNCNRNLEEKLKDLSSEKDKLLENKNELLNKLNMLIKTKEEMENDLYSTFLLLLNSKKKKIKELELSLKEYKSMPSDQCDPYEIDTENDSDIELPKEKSYKNKRHKSLKHKLSAEEFPKKKKLREKTKPTEKKADVDCLSSMKHISIKSIETKKEEKPLDKMEISEAVPGTSQDGLEDKVSNIGPSKNEGDKKKDIKELTKDELFDFFYGEL